MPSVTTRAVPNVPFDCKTILLEGWSNESPMENGLMLPISHDGASVTMPALQKSMAYNRMEIQGPSLSTGAQ